MLVLSRGCFSAGGSQPVRAQERQSAKGGSSDGEGIAENFIAIKSPKKSCSSAFPVPGILCQCALEMSARGESTGMERCQ